MRRERGVVFKRVLLLIAWLATFEVGAQEPPGFGDISAEMLQPRIARPRGEAVRRLERLQWLAEQQDWEQLCDVADELLATGVDGWVEAAPERYVGVRESVHRLLAGLPSEGLAAYRERVDPTASDWFRRGAESRDERLLQRVVDQAFCSSSGDDALWALGDAALERGEYQAARTAWQRIHQEFAGEGLLTFPDSQIAAAEVETRLALVSIREGDLERAQRETEKLAADHGDASGRLGGREVNLAARLSELLTQAREWPRAAGALGDWPTLFADQRRTNVNSISVPLPAATEFKPTWSADLAAPAIESILPQPTAFPVISNGVALLHDGVGVHAVSLDSTADDAKLRMLFAADAAEGPAIGSTITVSAEKAFAVVAAKPHGRGPGLATQLIGLALARDGALMFQRAPEGEGALFVGPPVVEGSRIAVCELAPTQGMKASVVCFDLWTGAVLWRRGLGWAFDPSLMTGAPSIGMAMSLDSGVLSINTNIGMVAAVRLRDGEPLWLRTYRRSFPAGEAAAMMPAVRSPRPCVVARSRVILAAQDSAEVMALDAATGAALWSTPLPDPTARLLAVDDGRVLLTGDRIWSIDATTGKLDAQWGKELAGEAGQGAVAGDLIFWPVTGEILLVDRSTGKPTGQALPLPAAGGANLVVGAVSRGADDAATDVYLVAAGPTKLSAFKATIETNPDERE